MYNIIGHFGYFQHFECSAPPYCLSENPFFFYYFCKCFIKDMPISSFVLWHFSDGCLCPYWFLMFPMTPPVFQFVCVCVCDWAWRCTLQSGPITNHLWLLHSSHNQPPTLLTVHSLLVIHPLKSHTKIRFCDFWDILSFLVSQVFLVFLK